MHALRVKFNDETIIAQRINPSKDEIDVSPQGFKFVFAFNFINRLGDQFGIHDTTHTLERIVFWEVAARSHSNAQRD